MEDLLPLIFFQLFFGGLYVVWRLGEEPAEEPNDEDRRARHKAPWRVR